MEVTGKANARVRAKMGRSVRVGEANGDGEGHHGGEEKG